MNQSLMDPFHIYPQRSRNPAADSVVEHTPESFHRCCHGASVGQQPLSQICPYWTPEYVLSVCPSVSVSLSLFHSFPFLCVSQLVCVVCISLSLSLFVYLSLSLSLSSSLAYDCMLFYGHLQGSHGL